MTYSAHENLVASARRQPSFWRLCLGLVVSTILYLGGSILLVGIAVSLVGQGWVNQAVVSGTSAGQVLFLLLTFVPWLAAVLLVAKLFQGRGIEDVIGAYSPTLLQFLLALRGMAPIIVIFVLLFLILEDRTPNLDFWSWLWLLPIALPLILVQTSTEEVLFRGYVQSQLAALNMPKIVWILGPSAVFAVLHYNPAIFGAATWWVVFWAFIFGVAAADITARAGTLGPAIALHFANNCFAFLLISYPDYMPGLALFTDLHSVTDTDAVLADLPYQFVGLFLMYVSVRIGIRR